FYPERQRVLQIDLDPTHLGKRAPIEMGVVGDIAATVDALLPRLETKQDKDHLNRALRQWEADTNEYEKAGVDKTQTLVHPQHVTRMLDKFADDDALFTADGGSPMVWLLRHLTARGDRRFLTSLLHGTMANAYPQAMGMAAAYP